MRQMMDQHGSKAYVVEHIILSNLWEYFIIEEAGDDGVAFALVVGDATEMGSVWMDNIEPYIISRTTELSDILPPPRWEWCDEVNTEWAPDALVCRWR